MASVDFWPPAPDLRRAEIGFSFRGNDYLGHLVAPPATAGPRPLVMVIHNYQGLKFFDVDVAEYLARVGYVGLAIDVYGNIVPPDERVFPTDPSRVQAFQKKCFEGLVAMDHDHDGVLLNLANPADHDEHGMWAGWAWREFVSTNTRVVHDIGGVSLATDDLDRTGQRYAELGFEFGSPFTDGPDEVVQATCPGGSFLQIRAPRGSESPGAELLDLRGPGLFHLCWRCMDLGRAREALAAAGAVLVREGKSAFWTDAKSTGIRVAMEFREPNG